MRILGRDDELAAMDQFLGGEQHRVLSIGGELGIGKTLLWDAGRSRAEELGHRVLQARAVESETPMGFATLGDLFQDVSEAVVSALPGLQSRALRVALLQADAGEQAADPRSVATAALGVLRTLSKDQPVLVAIDDVGWVDSASARVLSFALRRLGTESVRVMVTARNDERGGAPAVVTDVVGPDRVARLVPAPLSLGAVRALLDERLGFTPSRRLLIQVYEVAGGNPYFALELGRMLADGAPVGAGGELILPPTLHRLVHGRIAALTVDVRDVLLLAALSPGTPVEVILAAAPSSAAGSLEAAAGAGIIDVRGGQVVFSHPLLRSVLVGDATPEQLRSAHRRLTATAQSSIVRAVHAARSARGPDPALARELDDAARDAYLQGAVEAAAELAELAVTATSSGDTAERHRRVLIAAEYRFESGDPLLARRLVDDLLAGAAGTADAEALIRLATYQRYCGEPIAVWTATLDQALDVAPADAPRLRFDIHFALAVAAFNGGDPGEGPRHFGALSGLAESGSDPYMKAQVAAGTVWIDLISGRGLSTRLIELALADTESVERLPVEIRPAYTVANALAYTGDLVGARALYEREYAEASERGDEAALPIVLWMLVAIETWSGNWTRAEELAEHGLRAAELAGTPAGSAFMLASRATLLTCQGRVVEARADFEESLALAGRMNLVTPAASATAGAGLLELSIGAADAAHERLAAGSEAALAGGMAEPGACLFVTDDVEALIRLGRLAEAERLLRPFTERSAVLGRDRTGAAAGRCRGLLLAAEGDFAAAEEALEQALVLGEGLGLPFEHGRTLLVVAEVHRRARHRRKAQQRLGEARAVFEQLGAATWLARCDAELSRYGNRPAEDDSGLTATELQVAALAARGQTTREMAAALFMSVRTVESHLQHVYRKYGVRSRVELSRHLADAGLV